MCVSFKGAFLATSIETYLPLIPCRPTRSQDAVSDAACSEMVQDSMIRHSQHACIVLVRSVGIQNALAHEHW